MSAALSIVALVISALALAISFLTAWLTLLRRGNVKMTQPTQIFFGYDKSRDDGERPWPKVFLRALLFSTAKRGLVIENIYVKVVCEEITKTFSIWVYGDRNELVRGSGLFIGETGVEASHHFLASENGDPFNFISGTYHLEVHANVLRERDSQLLFSADLNVSHEESDSIGFQGSGLYFDWDPDEKEYMRHVKQAPGSFFGSNQSILQTDVSSPSGLDPPLRPKPLWRGEASVGWAKARSAVPTGSPLTSR